MLNETAVINTNNYIAIMNVPLLVIFQVIWLVCFARGEKVNRSFRRNCISAKNTLNATIIVVPRKELHNKWDWNVNACWFVQIDRSRKPFIRQTVP
jgi:hypothetical protein